MRDTDVKHLNLLGASLLLLLLGMGAAAAADQDSPVLVTLKPLAAVESPTVRIGQIASLQGGNAELRERIQSLDIADGPTAGQNDVVSRSFVEMRIVLAGISREAFRVAGARQTSLTQSTDTDSDQQLLHAIRDPLAEHFRVAPDDLRLRLTQPLIKNSSLSAAEGHSLRFEPFIPDNLAAGSTRLSVAVHVDGQLRVTMPVSLEIRVYRNVPVAARNISHGEEISADEVRWQRLALSGRALSESADDVVGRTARITIRRGQVIRLNQLDRQSDQHDPYLIQRRDRVRMVARKGGLVVTVPNCEALQQGRLGDSIRVRNPTTKKIVTGRVVSPSEVQLRF